MAHFAEIDENNIVIRVLVVDDSQEHRGQEFLANDLRLGGRWIQTSYNDNFRKIYAGAGMVYNEEGNVFHASQPYPSWTIDENYDWNPPTPKPTSDGNWNWDEANLEWVDGLPLS